jgi:hypothetical protein
MRKKAQTEIIGVAVIVIILVLAGTVMIGLGLRKNPSQLGSYVDPEISQSFLNALMNTETDYSIVSDVIKDCYSPRNVLCSDTGDCCDYAYGVIQNALDATLGTWGKNYKLTISKDGEIRIPPNGQPDSITNDIECGELSIQEQPGYYYIPPQPPIIVKLIICT